MALDKTKPYGTITGDDQGRAYEQDGVFYSGNGEAWQPPGEEGSAPAPAAKPKSKKPEAAPEAGAVDAELAAQMGQA